VGFAPPEIQKKIIEGCVRELVQELDLHGSAPAGRRIERRIELLQLTPLLLELSLLGADPLFLWPRP